ncbi:MAG TPA: L-glutamate gamma-semialdehyde dehydrogenase [Chthonomonadaceae bacterium]|nr:L-glutamate gamma-semialdehyde dehydrogenase [Chthonomonadaceae bacterium]
MFTPFQNEPVANFTEEAPRHRMETWLGRIQADLGRVYPLVIAGQRIESKHQTPSRNPAQLAQVVGIACDAPEEMADRAVQAALEAYGPWSRLPVETRARYLVKAAAILRRRSYEFAAWLVLECSKNWYEAYADVAEAIDFLEFYARQAPHWFEPVPTTPWPGEENEVFRQPIGVGAIISPWNFPLAILCGMTAAAIVTGNTVVIKPAEQTPVIAAKFVELLEVASLPPGVVNLLFGPGATIGEALTGHPQVRFVSFTGSKEVGLHINQRIATPQRGQRWIKRGIFEMGGKNAIVVDSDVNLDIAASEIIVSAFGFQGQKCSACSRLIAVDPVYDKLLEKVVERASKLTVGDPASYSNYLGAVIDDAAYNKITGYIASGRSEGRLLLGGNDSEDTNDGGYFVHPAIIADVAPTARIAQEEIFGPVLAVMRAATFEEALQIANSTEFGLTGAVYSNNRAHVELARREFHVGNLYLNRKCTGATVDVQPFGGFNLSGTNSKAGGRDYLGLFLETKAVSERW